MSVPVGVEDAARILVMQDLAKPGVAHSSAWLDRLDDVEREKVFDVALVLVNGGANVADVAWYFAEGGSVELAPVLVAAGATLAEAAEFLRGGDRSLEDLAALLREGVRPGYYAAEALAACGSAETCGELARMGVWLGGVAHFVRAGGTQEQALQMAHAGGDLTGAAHLMLEGNSFDEVLAAAQRGELAPVEHYSHHVLDAPAADEPRSPEARPRRQQWRRPPTEDNARSAADD